MTHNRLMAYDKFMTNNKQNRIGLITILRWILLYIHLILHSTTQPTKFKSLSKPYFCSSKCMLQNLFFVYSSLRPVHVMHGP